jgi:hypothetical protein
MAQNVLVQHRVKFNDKGDAIGLEFHKVGQRVMPISHFFKHRSDKGNRMVRVPSGDTWAVRPVNHDHYQFVTTL